MEEVITRREMNLRTFLSRKQTSNIYNVTHYTEREWYEITPNEEMAFLSLYADEVIYRDSPFQIFEKRNVFGPVVLEYVSDSTMVKLIISKICFNLRIYLECDLKDLICYNLTCGQKHYLFFPRAVITNEMVEILICGVNQEGYPPLVFKVEDWLLYNPNDYVLKSIYKGSPKELDVFEVSIQTVSNAELVVILSTRKSIVGNLLRLTLEGEHIPSENKDDDTIVKYISIVSPETYKDWLTIGSIMKGISPCDNRYLSHWMRLYARIRNNNETNSTEINFELLWDGFMPSSSSIGCKGSLMVVAKDTNLLKYKTVTKQSVWEMVKQCCDFYIIITQEENKLGEMEFKLKKRSFDDVCYYLANIVSYIFQSFYVCTSYERKSWMRFNNHRWMSSDKGVDLCRLMDTELYTIFSFWSINYMMDFRNSTDGAETKFRKECYYKACCDFGNMMRNPRKKRQLLDVCCEKMFWTNYALESNNSFMETLDENKKLIGMLNGVYDLDKGVFRKGYPADFVSMSTKTNYVVYDWEHPMVQQIQLFLSKVFPCTIIRLYVCKLLASFMDGHLIEKFYIWTGVGGNGKSKLIELFQLAMGDYYATLPVTLITGQRQSSSGATPELARMKGKRLGVMNESNHNDSIDLGLVKTTTGGDMIYARALHKDPIEFRPTFQMLLLCNKKPKRIDSTDLGAWRRITILRFTSRFVSHPNPSASNEFTADKHLDEKLVLWKEAFFWMLTQYYKLLQDEGNPEPDTVLQETEIYRESNDVVGRFFKDCVDISAADESYLSENQLFKAFIGYRLKEHNEKCRMLHTEFEEHLSIKFGDFTAPRGVKGWSNMIFKDINMCFIH